MIHLPGALAVILSFLTHPLASGTGGSPTDALAPEQGLVTREWSWADGDGVTVLTARGPAEQVAAFEPGDPTSRCPNCLLMSSVAFEEPEASTDPSQPTKALAIEGR